MQECDKVVSSITFPLPSVDCQIPQQIYANPLIWHLTSKQPDQFYTTKLRLRLLCTLLVAYLGVWADANLANQNYFLDLSDIFKVPQGKEIMLLYPVHSHQMCTMPSQCPSMHLISILEHKNFISFD